MPNRVHFIPVGFDFDRLIFPISKGDLNADKVVLVTHQEDENESNENHAAILAANMANRLAESFELIDVAIEWVRLQRETLYDYEELYPLAFRMIRDELESGNEIYLNISSMPRPVAFAFATAADSLISENPDKAGEIRNRVHTYYVSPEKYLVLEMIKELREERDFLTSLAGDEDIRVHNRLQSITNLINSIEERGVTRGASVLNDKMFIEFPASPGGAISEFESELLRYLAVFGPEPSTSSLAEGFSEEEGIEYNSSFRSRVQYNANSLEEKGYINRDKIGNRLETSLSTMGRMWVETH